MNETERQCAYDDITLETLKMVKYFKIAAVLTIFAVGFAIILAGATIVSRG